jgi:Domain of unknown function (DUF4430)
VKRVALVAFVLALAGCGGEHTHGTATLWVTSDRGTHVLFAGKVPAGLTAMQALVRVQKVSTRYGGRYVQSIDGVSGSLSAEKDWFFFVNGVESGTGAAEVHLRPGDVEWWDYRSWRGGGMSVPVVVGAFPEPFLHGFQWAKPGATVVYFAKRDASVAARLARSVHGKVKSVIPPGPGKVVAWEVHGNLIEVGKGTGLAGIRDEGHVVWLSLTSAQAAKLAASPTAFRYRYQVSK